MIIGSTNWVDWSRGSLRCFIVKFQRSERGEIGLVSSRVAALMHLINKNRSESLGFPLLGGLLRVSGRVVRWVEWTRKLWFTVEF